MEMNYCSLGEDARNQPGEGYDSMNRDRQHVLNQVSVNRETDVSYLCHSMDVINVNEDKQHLMMNNFPPVFGDEYQKVHNYTGCHYFNTNLLPDQSSGYVNIKPEFPAWNNQPQASFPSYFNLPPPSDSYTPYMQPYFTIPQMMPNYLSAFAIPPDLPQFFPQSFQWLIPSVAYSPAQFIDATRGNIGNSNYMGLPQPGQTTTIQPPVDNFNYYQMNGTPPSPPTQQFENLMWYNFPPPVVNPKKEFKPNGSHDNANYVEQHQRFVLSSPFKRVVPFSGKFEEYRRINGDQKEVSASDSKAFKRGNNRRNRNKAKPRE